MEVKYYKMIPHGLLGYLVGELSLEENFKETLILGKDFIFPVGYTYNVDSDWWETQDAKWKDKYPELCTDKFRLSILTVINVDLIDSVTVNVSWNKKTYKIQSTAQKAIVGSQITLEEIIATTK